MNQTNETEKWWTKFFEDKTRLSADKVFRVVEGSVETILYYRETDTSPTRSIFVRHNWIEGEN